MCALRSHACCVWIHNFRTPAGWWCESAGLSELSSSAWWPSQLRKAEIALYPHPTTTPKPDRWCREKNHFDRFIGLYVIEGRVACGRAPCTDGLHCVVSRWSQQPRAPWQAEVHLPCSPQGKVGGSGLSLWLFCVLTIFRYRVLWATSLEWLLVVCAPRWGWGLLVQTALGNISWMAPCGVGVCVLGIFFRKDYFSWMTPCSVCVRGGGCHHTHEYCL